MHYETDDDDSASEDSAVLLFFFSVHREFFLIELTLMVRIFPLAMLVYCGCGRMLRKTWEMFEKDGFYSKKMKKMGTEKAEYSYRSLVAPTRQKQKEGVLVFA